MPQECDACGETFNTLSRLRLHDCPADEPDDPDPMSSFDAFLDSISDALDADMEQRHREREKRGLNAASETLKTIEAELPLATRRGLDVQRHGGMSYP